MGNWEGDNWVHILCPLVETIGVPHATHDVDIDDELANGPIECNSSEE